MSIIAVKPQANPELDLVLAQATGVETPSPEHCARIARLYNQAGREVESCQWALRVVDAGENYIAWQACARLIGKMQVEQNTRVARKARLAILGSYTTTHLVPLLR